MNDPKQLKSPLSTRVVVFGAGITGLTAAHELAVRGFPVEVIAPEINTEVRGNTLDRGIGGMARSQFVVDVEPNEVGDAGSPSTAEMRRRVSTESFLIDETLVFKPSTSADPADRPRAREIVRRLAEAIRWLRDNSNNPFALRIGIPDGPARPTPAPSKEARRNWLLDRLREELGEPEFVLDNYIPRDSAVDDTGADPRCWIIFDINFRISPSEHGFRFFPSFYRHLFDTMKRTQILAPRSFEIGRNTVFENLVPSEGLGLARRAPAQAFLVPRRPSQSFEEIRKYLDLVLSELDYTLQDIARYQLALFKYMTSSTERRRQQYENMSWGEFVQLERFSPTCRRHIEFGPQMTAALRGSQSDARTQGNITVQLILDQLRPAVDVDSTLDGPTSGAWFDHWYRFLAAQGVGFTRRRIERFEAKAGRVVPILDDGSTVDATYIVLALSLPEIHALAPSFLKAASDARTDLEPDNDMKRVISFVERDLGRDTFEADLQRDAPRGPLQHLSGIQFYFATDVRFWRGHTQYLDSEWGLTSISQPQFWLRSRVPVDTYRSVLSVDIGIWDVPHEGCTAWECPLDDIAQHVWSQIEAHHWLAFAAAYGESAALPRPVAYALDHDLVTRHGGNSQEKGDLTPFLVNRTGAYRGRPGQLSHDPQQPSAPSYRLLDNKYVIAGTFAQTFTRLTSMEGANESGRHAVNAVIAASGVETEPCMIWDPEANELPDLAWLRELDAKLLSRNLPHMVDILGWRELPEQLLPRDLARLTFGGAL